MNDELYAKNFNDLIDRYLFKGGVDPEEYEKLTELQKAVVQVIKRAKNRNK